jgi:hypothetical protein
MVKGLLIQSVAAGVTESTSYDFADAGPWESWNAPQQYRTENKCHVEVGSDENLVACGKDNNILLPRMHVSLACENGGGEVNCN